MHSGGLIDTTPVCPRCGYDQSGGVAAWTDRCPVVGRCPECGTELRWADLFRPDRQTLAWFVEHTGAPVRQLARSGPTLARMALPWMFWSRVDVAKRTASGNLLRWLLLVVAVSHLLAWPPVSAGVSSKLFRIPLSQTSTMVADYGWVVLRDPAATGMVWPLAHFRGGGLQAGSLATQYLAERMMMWALPLGYGLVWFLLLGCLPVTRRVARIRMAHPVRGLLLQCGVIVLCLQVTRSLYLFESSHPWTGRVVFGLFYGVGLWTVVWWWCAVWKGWGIRSPALLVLGTVAGLLGGLTLFATGAAAL
jgi:hypothetical protein